MQTDSILQENLPLNISPASTLPYSEAQHYGLDLNSFIDSSISAIQPEQILYIDSAVEDYQVLIDGFAEPMEVVLLDSQQDGLVQITESLQQYQRVEFEAIHIVSHGDIGELFLGNTSFDRDNLDSYQGILSSWSDLMSADGDILLYGCNVGADLAGAEFLETLSQYTQADILASTDLTGSEDLGGDWDLEFAVGEIEAKSAFDESIGSDYQSALVGSNFDLSVNPIFNNYLDTNFPITGGNSGFNFVFNNDLIDAGLDINSSFQSVSPGQLNNALGINLNNYSYNNAGYNSILFGFSPSALNFDSTNFNFSSMTIDSKYIKFDFEPSDFNFNFADGFRDSMDFRFNRHEFKFDSMFEFDSSDVRFDGNSVRFEYNNFDFKRERLFQSHVNLLDYKFTESEIFSLESRDEIRFTQQLNASDFRAMRYGFDGDFMFDSNYYIKEYDIDPNNNPFTDYVENGFELDRNPNALFDTSYYNGNNPAVAASVKTGLEDYMAGGWRIGLIGDPNYDPEQNTDPNAIFSSEDYFTIHDDVRVESYDPEANSPLEDLMNFGLVEGRVFNKALQADEILKTSITITKNSDPALISQTTKVFAEQGFNFEFADDNENINIAQITPVDDVLNPYTAGAVVLSFIVGVAYVGYKTIEKLDDAIDLGDYDFSDAEITGDFSTITLVPVDSERSDVISVKYENPELEDLLRSRPFPEQTESQRNIEIFRPPAIDGVQNYEVLPIEDGILITETTEFPQGDQILEDILDGTFVLPIGEGLFQRLFTIEGGGNWYKDYLNGEDPDIKISNPKTFDVTRERLVRKEFADNTNFNSKTRAKYRQPFGGNVAIADFNIGNKTGTLRGISGDNGIFKNGIPVQIEGVSPYVPQQQREIQAGTAEFLRDIDPESKILEDIFNRIYEPGDKGTIRLISSNPICDGCGGTIENFLEAVEETGGKISIEIIQTRITIPQP